MDKIKAEMDSSQNPWIKKIGNYLLSRNDLEDKLNNQNKSLKECFDYILIEISKSYLNIDLLMMILLLHQRIQSLI